MASTDLERGESSATASKPNGTASATTQETPEPVIDRLDLKKLLLSVQPRKPQKDIYAVNSNNTSNSPSSPSTLSSRLVSKPASSLGDVLRGRSPEPNLPALPGREGSREKEQ